MNEQYIYAEPEQVTRLVFLDNTSSIHETREAAIAANIRSDLRKKIAVLLVAHIPDSAAVRGAAADAIVADLATQYSQTMLKDFLESLE